MATSWAPAYDLDGTGNIAVTAYVIPSLMDDYFLNPYVPVYTNDMTTWMFLKAGYTPPTSPIFLTPPTYGRGWPR